MAEPVFTVDTQIVLFGFDKTKKEEGTCHADFLKEFYKTAFLALDKEEKVRTEYLSKMKTQSPARIWLGTLDKNNRTRAFSAGKIPLDKASE